jgi:uroporphyrinogen-III synthase
MFIWIMHLNAEIITLIYNRKATLLSGNLRKTLPEALNAGITFNEIEVYETKLAPFKISDKSLTDFVF